jgi:hypothetical protein
VLAVALLLAVSGRLTLPFGPHRPGPLPGYHEDQYEPEQSSRISGPQRSQATDRWNAARPSTVAHDLKQYMVHQAALGYQGKPPKEVSCRRSHTLDGRNDLPQAFTASYNCTLTWSSGTVRKWCAYSIYPTPFATAAPKTCEAVARDLLVREPPRTPIP